MGIEECPGVDRERIASTEVSQTIKEVLPICIGPEDFTAGNSSANHVVERAGRIKSSVAGHTLLYVRGLGRVNNKFTLNQRPRFSVWISCPGRGMDKRSSPLFRVGCIRLLA